MKNKDVLVLILLLLLLIGNISLFRFVETTSPLMVFERYDELKDSEIELKRLMQTSANLDVEIDELRSNKEEAIQLVENIEYLNYDFYFDLPSILIFLEQTALNNELSFSIGQYQSMRSIDGILDGHIPSEEEVDLDEGLDNESEDNGVGGFGYYAHEERYEYSNSSSYSPISMPNFEEFDKLINDIQVTPGLNNIPFLISVSGEYLNISKYIRKVEQENYIKVNRYQIEGQTARIEIEVLALGR